MTTINIVGIDPSLRNFGMVKCKYDLHKNSLNLVDVKLVNALSSDTEASVSLQDVDVATQICAEVLNLCEDAHLLCIELPSGHQSARGAISNGICIGIIAMLNTQGIPIVLVTPKQVKLVTGNNGASKDEMVNWFNTKFPNHPKVLEIKPSSRHHIADAMASLYAGLRTRMAQTHINLLKGN